MVVVLEQPVRLPSVRRPKPIATAVETDAKALFIANSLQISEEDAARSHVLSIGRFIARRVPRTAAAGRVPDAARDSPRTLIAAAVPATDRSNGPGSAARNAA